METKYVVLSAILGKLAAVMVLVVPESALKPVVLKRFPPVDAS
jgi:hypothetical protein